MKEHDWQTADGRVRLYCADCLEILPQLDAGSVDAVVTDPPYGIGFRYESHVDDKDSYPSFLWPRIEAAERLIKPGGPVFVWQSQEWMPQFGTLFPRKWRVFVAAKNFVQIRPTVMQHAYEPIVVWWTDGPKEEWGRDLGLMKRDWYVANSAAQVVRVAENYFHEHFGFGPRCCLRLRAHQRHTRRLETYRCRSTRR